MILKIFTLALTLLLLGCTTQEEPLKQANTPTDTTVTSVLSSNPYIVLQTSAGDIEIELFPDVAPKTVENFMTHIKNGYYDGIAFHRIIKDFMIQGGDPTETGAGSQSIWNKDFNDEFTNKVFDKPGILAMANRGLDRKGQGTNGSQFFITTIPTPWLNGHHTIFGQITAESHRVLDTLNNTPVDGSTPISRVEIIKAYIKSEGK